MVSGDQALSQSVGAAGTHSDENAATSIWHAVRIRNYQKRRRETEGLHSLAISLWHVRLEVCVLADLAASPARRGAVNVRDCRVAKLISPEAPSNAATNGYHARTNKPAGTEQPAPEQWSWAARVLAQGS